MAQAAQEQAGVQTEPGLQAHSGPQLQADPQAQLVGLSSFATLVVTEVESDTEALVFIRLLRGLGDRTERTLATQARGQLNEAAIRGEHSPA